MICVCKQVDWANGRSGAGSAHYMDAPAKLCIFGIENPRMTRYILSQNKRSHKRWTVYILAPDLGSFSTIQVFLSERIFDKG